jgi:sugar phosphate isomerase/epimerase
MQFADPQVRSLALHQITAMEAGPLELVEIAARAGAQAVCIFVYLPPETLPGRKGPDVRFPAVERSMKTEMLHRLRDNNVSVTNLEFFPLGPQVDVSAFAGALELGKELGGRRAVTHVHDANEERALDRLGQLCELAARFELDVGLEFLGLSAACASLERAVDLVKKARQPNLGIGVDPLHLVRTGGTPEEILAIDACRFSYAQLCDGLHLARSTDYLDEAFNRTLPGDGCFPLRELMSALPATVPLDVEVPSEALRAQGITALQRATAAVEASRRLLASVVHKR